MMAVSRGLAVGTLFSPYLAASNRSSKPLSVKPVFSYAAHKGVAKVALPEIVLAAQQSAVVNLRQYQEQGLIPASVGMGDIDLQYQGEAGALIAELTSVDQNGTFVSPVPLICRGAKALQMSYWRTDGDWHSSVTLQNIAAKTNNVEVTISYGGGVYVFDKQIAAGETAMISINELQQSQEPDKEGRRLPKEVTMGGVNIWSQNLNDGIVMNAMLMNPVTKTCGSCGGNGYVIAYVVSDTPANTQTSLYSGFNPHLVNQGFQVYINVRYSTGSQSGDAPLSTTSGNPSVATASAGYVVPVAPGTTNITAGSGLYFTDVGCSQPGYLTPSPSAMLTVLTVTLQKSDGTALPSPFRVGITGTVISGTPINRKQSLKVVVKPEAEAANILIGVTPKLQKSNVVANSSTGIITFDVVGLTKSATQGDSTITVRWSTTAVKTAAVSVVVPNNVSADHDKVGGGVVIANQVLSATSSPSAPCLPAGQVYLYSNYLRYLTITVCDQFGDLIGSIYQGAEVSEPSGCGGYATINQPLSSASTYLDPVGTGQLFATVVAGSNSANNWPNSSIIPPPSGCATIGPVDVPVRVDGFELNPAIVNRSFTICGNGSSITAPPVTLTITWP